MKTLKKLFRYIGRSKYLLLLSAVLALVYVFSSLYIPILVGKCIDFMVGKGKVDFESIFTLLTGILALAIIGFISQRFMAVINNKVMVSVVKQVRNDLFNKIQKLPIRTIEIMKAGNIVSTVITDAENLGDGILLGLNQFFTGVVTIIATFIFMLTINPIITVLVVALTPLSFFIAKGIAKGSFKHFKAQAEIRGRQTNIINESVENFKLIKSFGCEDVRIEEFDKANKDLASAGLKATFISSLVNPSTRVVNNLIYAVVAISGGILALNGGITIGGLTCFLNYANSYTKPFNEISEVITEFQNALACTEHIFKILDSEELDYSDRNGVIDEVKGEIEIKNVSFAYTENRDILKDFSLDIEPGTHVAVIGETGCGKSTLINLLLGFYEPDKGQIYIDGADITTLSKSTLCSIYGLVLQETWIKGGTVRDNLLLSIDEATDEDMIDACKKAYAHDFIMRLPKGYDTVITDESGLLSGGERQLLAIARMILKNPKILILDEATSNVDIETEKRINKAFRNLMKGRTAIIVAHRPITIESADRVVKMVATDRPNKGSSRI